MLFRLFCRLPNSRGFPPTFSSLSRGGAALLGRHSFGSGSPALATQSRRCRVFTPLLWRRFPILYLAARNIDHELGELGRVAGAFWALYWHGESMPMVWARCQRAPPSA